MGTKATSTSCPNCGRRIELKLPYLCKMCGYSMIHKRCINYPKDIVRPLSEMDHLRVADANAAESTAKRYLETQKKVVDAKVIRIWPPNGTKGGWEVDGIVTVRKRLLMKERKSFLLQIDPETGDVTNFETPPLWRTTRRQGITSWKHVS